MRKFNYNISMHLCRILNDTLQFLKLIMEHINTSGNESEFQLILVTDVYFHKAT